MGSFEISRTALLDADPARVYDLVADLHAWPRWSPWERLDASLQRSYGGAAQGTGATYAWQGNRRAGAGSMTITRATAEEIDLDVTFDRPFRATQQVVFVLDPTPAGATQVTWTLAGERGPVAGLLARVVPIDRLLGRDLERGLAGLGAAAAA